jgi:UDP-glucuronate 4-epimerase
MKILITGTAGFIGFHVAKRLLERGDEVVGIDNINDYYDVNLKYARLAELGINVADDNFTWSERVTSKMYKKHTFIKMDLADTTSINTLFEEEQFDAVCNLAAQAGVRYSLENPHTYIQSNVVGFMNILEACRHNGVKNLCYASSSSIYGLNKSQPFKTSDHTDHQVSIYAATKKSNEVMAHTYAHLYGIATTGLRFFTVYGPWGRPDMSPIKFAKAITEGNPIDVYNYGKHQRDFTYIDDIVEGLIAVLDKPAQPDPEWSGKDPSSASSKAPWKVYNIGNNDTVELLDYITCIEKHLDMKAEMNMLPLQPGDVVATYADVDALIADVGYKPGTKLDDGIKKFIDWYKDYYLS